MSKPLKSHSLTPPEGVTLHFEVASLSTRFGAQLLDILITVTTVVLICLTLLFANILSGSNFSALAALLFFALRVPYYVFAELMWNGQTLGKRILGLRVVATDGLGLSAYAVTVRNMMKEAEVFMPGLYLVASSFLDGWTRLIVLVWVAILLIVPLRSRLNQRLGDIIAGTYVVLMPKPVLLPDLAADSRSADLEGFLPHHLDHYGRFELQTLEDLLRVRRETLKGDAEERHLDTLGRVANTIAERIGWGERIEHADALSFLERFYRVQRGYLENRRLFGDAREDKYHRSE
ncbi:MAG: RDD family protein [Pseudomonadota bacterium]